MLAKSCCSAYAYIVYWIARILRKYKRGEASKIQGKVEVFPLRDKNCLLYLPPHGEGSLPLAVVFAGNSLAGQLEPMMELVESAVQQGLCRPFALAAFGTNDWGRDYTPWPAPPLQKKGEPFGGKAGETLAFVLDTLLPYLEKNHDLLPGPEGRMLAGYSLGGLAALWAAYQTDAFGAVASCSGSLWYDGWAEYMEKNHPAGRVNIYLSLGRNEEKTRNARMKPIGDNTRTADWHYNQDAHVVRNTLKMNPGGHFSDIPERLADALIWMNKI